MIINLHNFVKREQPLWEEFEQMLRHIDKDHNIKFSLHEVQRFHYLYQRTSAGFSKLKTYTSQREISLYLESLISNAYGYIHGNEQSRERFSFIQHFFSFFPSVFRKHIRMFYLSAGIFLIGSAFGATVIIFDSPSKEVILPFDHLKGSPNERVEFEEKTRTKDLLEDSKGSFSSYLITHNTKVSILAMALGMSFGLGTIFLLFYNGVILGAVSADYIIHGETVFLLGWILPHGAAEIPAMLIGGQTGFLLASALIGWGKPITIRKRLKRCSQDLVILIFGVAILLIWAGIIESFFSQYHKPVIPYAVKIAFGLMEIIILSFFLTSEGNKKNGLIS